MSNATPPIVEEYEKGRVLVFDSATYVKNYLNHHEGTRGDIIVASSYSGVLCAKMIIQANPRAVIGLDCAIGKDGAGISGLWFYEALNIPSAAVNVMTAEMGNGRDMYESGILSRVNDSAQAYGLKPGMSVRQAVMALIAGPDNSEAYDPTRRLIVETDVSGRSIVCTDSIAFSLPEDREKNVLCTAGHTGRSVINYFREFRPWGFICSDGGIGKNNSGIVALKAVETDGIPGASVDANSARMGDGQSTYFDGVISTVNRLAAEKGVRPGQSAREAAKHLLS